MSCSAEDPTVEWGEGTAQTTGEVVNDLAEIEVLTNEPIADFVGQKFYIDKDANPDGETKYPLYDAEGNAVGILVTITEAESEIIVDPVEPVVEPVTTKHKLRLNNVWFNLDSGNQYGPDGQNADLFVNGVYINPSAFESESYSAELPNIGDGTFNSYVEVEEDDEIVFVLYNDIEPVPFNADTLEQITMNENAVNPTDNPDAYFAGFTQGNKDTLAYIW